MRLLSKRGIAAAGVTASLRRWEMFIGWLITAPRAAIRAVIAIALTTSVLIGGTATAATATAATATAAAATAAAATPFDGTYVGTGYIENRWSHRCLDEDRNAGIVDRAIVQVYQCNGWTNQQWKFYLEPGGNGHVYYLINVYSGKCLDADLNTINRNGTRIQVYGCNGWSNQDWLFPLVSAVPVWVSNFWYGFTGSPPTDMLDQNNSTGVPGNGRVQLYQYEGGLNQEWTVFLS